MGESDRCRWRDRGPSRPRRWATIVALALLPSIVACSADTAPSNPDSARGAPPEPQRTATADTPRNDSTAAPGATTPDLSSPWPTDTFDVRIDRWSFEVPAQQAKIPPCGDATPVITGDSIGALRAGLTRAEVERRCARLHYGWYYSDDQAWTPAANVRMGRATLLVEFNGTAPDARVTRVAAMDSVARTTDGLHAGSSLADARGLLGEPTLVAAKCAVFARWPSRPGLIARIVLEDESGWECSAMRQVAERNALARVPAGSRIGYFAQEPRAGP